MEFQFLGGGKTDNPGHRFSETSHLALRRPLIPLQLPLVLGEEIQTETSDPRAVPLPLPDSGAGSPSSALPRAWLPSGGACALWGSQRYAGTARALNCSHSSALAGAPHGCRGGTWAVSGKLLMRLSSPFSVPGLSVTALSLRAESQKRRPCPLLAGCVGSDGAPRWGLRGHRKEVAEPV